MNKEDYTLVIFKELLSRWIHGIDEDVIKSLYNKALKLSENLTDNT